MSQMSSRERFMAAIQNKPVDRLPVISVCQHATYEQMDQLNSHWPEAMFDAEKMAALAGGAYTILGWDAVRLPFCQTHEAEALGATLKDGGKTGLPSVNVHPYKIGDEIDFPEDFLSRGRIPQLLEGIKKLKDTMGDKVIIMGGIIGGFSIAASLIGITEILKEAFKKPKSIVPYIEIGEKAGTLLGKAMIDAGADVICIEDMMASLDMISPKIYRDLVAPYEKKQVEALNVPTIIHICGKLDKIMPDIAATGCSAISVEPVVDIAGTLMKFKEVGITTPLVGAIDPVNTLFSGEVEKVKAETKEAIAKGFAMISPGCAVPPGTPTANLKAIIETVNEAEAIVQ